VQPDLNLDAKTLQRAPHGQRAVHGHSDAARRFDRVRLGAGQAQAAQQKTAAWERGELHPGILEHHIEIRRERRESCRRQPEKPALLKVHTCVAGNAVHRGCKPKRPGERHRMGARGDAGRRRGGKFAEPQMLREPRAPTLRQCAAAAKASDALKPGQRWRARRSFLLRQKQVGDDDDELMHKRVF
jgi:hypothetical protein